MLVSLAKLTHAAERGKYAVGAFNTINLEITQAIVAAAVRERAPVIISISEKALEYSSDLLPAIVLALAERAPVPIALHLDHGKSFERIRWCFRRGFTSVMYDGSDLPFAENLRNTKKAVQLSHAKGVSVEGELGRIGGREDAGQVHRMQMTDPKEARTFVQRTGIDVFAPAFGNAHGGQWKSEQLDFVQLAAIHAAVRVPLAFHGASETPSAHFRRAIRLGVRKINVDTALRKAFVAALRRTLRRQPQLTDPRASLAPSRGAVEHAVRNHLRLFGSAGRA